MPRKDYTGKRFGKLVAVKYDHTRGVGIKSKAWWEFLCDCGNTRVANTAKMRAKGDSAACLQCQVSGNAMDYTGVRFGKLVGEAFHHSTEDNARVWLMRCDCGGSRLITPSKLNSEGEEAACLPCRKLEGVGILRTATVVREAGSSQGLTYASWQAMKTRCLNVNDHGYPNYGGRGIKIYQPWIESYDNFLSDMGERPEGTTIDRIDGNGNYEPGNCRWATPTEQNNNLSSNHRLSFNGESLTVKQWSRKLKINDQTLHERLKAGWPLEKALTEPVKK